jgi:hypothetical protein
VAFPLGAQADSSATTGTAIDFKSEHGALSQHPENIE